jgi:hypothetical protein
MRNDQDTSFIGDGGRYAPKRLCASSGRLHRVFAPGKRAQNWVLEKSGAGLRKTLVHFLAGEALSHAKIDFDEAIINLQRNMRGLCGGPRREARA